jgi:curli biogenesis system outer membrane secretion channel CsgG
MLTNCVAMLLTVGIGAQSTPAKPAATTQKPAAPKAAPVPSDVDNIVALVKGGMSEARVIRSVQDAGKAYKLSPADLLKLQKAGVSEKIIDVMENPGAGAAAPAASSAAPASRESAKAVTEAVAQPFGPSPAYPPDLPDVPKRKRMLAVIAFDHAAVQPWVTYWFNGDYNVGDGIRSMLERKLERAQNVTLLERSKADALRKEQYLGTTPDVRRGTNARLGQFMGADAMLFGDIVIFGRDDTTKGQGGEAIVRNLPGLGGLGVLLAGAMAMNREEKAVVGINLRLVDVETGVFLATEDARGESSRKSKDYSVFLRGAGAAAGARSSMTSSNFQETIIGEATLDAVTKIAAFLERKVPELPAKARQIEGYVARLAANGTYINIGSEAGVLRGDRFEILKVNEEIPDPVTREVIGLDAVRVGELVVDTVYDKIAVGRYGGQPLSDAHIALTGKGKGYAARLIIR